MCSDAMRRMQWRGCHKLEQMLLACSYLQEAEFLACHSLCDDMLLTMGDAGKGSLLTSRGIQGACPRLRCSTCHTAKASFPMYLRLYLRQSRH